MAATDSLDKLQKLAPRIDGVQAELEPKLNAAIPTVKIELPRLTPEMFGAAPSGYEKVPASGELGRIEEGGKEALVSAQAAATKAASQVEVFIASLMGQASSFAVAFGLGIASLKFNLGSLGPVISAVVVALTSMLSLAKVQKARTVVIFEAIQKQIQDALNMVLSVLDTVDKQVLDPVEQIMGTVDGFATAAMTPLVETKDSVTAMIDEILKFEIPIPDAASLKQPLTDVKAKLDELVAQATEVADKMTADYKDDLQKIQSAEATVRKVKPDFDVPDPSDLPKEVSSEVKTPMLALIKEAEDTIDGLVDTLKPPFAKVNDARDQLKGAASSLEIPNADAVMDPLKAILGTVKEFVQTAKEQVPTIMEDLLGSTLPGKVMTSEFHFNAVFVALPLFVSFCINMPVAVMAALRNATEIPEPSDETAVADSPGANTTNSTTLDGWLPNVPAGQEMDALKPYYMPAVSQLILIATQIFLALLLTAKRIACRMANSGISSFETKLNNQINQRIDDAVGKIFRETFAVVKSKTSELTGKLKAVLGKVEQALKKVVDVEKLRDEAEQMKKQVMKSGQEASEKVEKKIEEEKGKMDKKREDMEKRIQDAAQVANTMSNPAAAMGKLGKKRW